MRVTIAAVAVAAVLAGCGANTDTTATRTETATPTASAARTVLGPGSVPGGWGDVRPDVPAIHAMAQWVGQRSRLMIANMSEAQIALDNVVAAKNDGDVSAMKSACQQVSEQLTVQLAAHLPTPEPDLTHALQSVVDAGATFATKCDALTDPARSSDLQSLWEALLTVSSAMTTATRFFSGTEDSRRGRRLDVREPLLRLLWSRPSAR